MVPAAPGVFSAMGLLVSDLKRDHVQTHVSDLMAEPAATVQQRFEQLEAAARRELAEEGIPEDQITCERALDLRYAIQKYELPVPIAPGALSDADKPAWRSAFDEKHEHTFGTRAPDQRVEIVSYRLTARVALPRPEAPRHPVGPPDAAAALKGRRKAYFTAGGWHDTPVYDRTKLDAGHRFEGPAIVEQPDCTTVVHPGQRVRVDPWRNLIIETAAGR
jgi:N-methylhydantoinase A